ncbi:MAG TPA: alpha/beta hydrolase [Allosphingosinicella sp.]|nr:alpha/beta hydrolase [Allosphingosinicella sp.]
MKWFLGILLILAAALGGFYALVAPPRQLDLLDRLWPGDSGSRRVAHDLAYGDSPRQKLDVYDNGQAGGRPKPVLVFFYGGGWHGGDKDHYGFAARAYAAKGFLVILPDYRLVPDVRFPAFVQDSAAAIAWTWRNAGRFGGDPNRIVTAGHSAGAYNAVMPALDRRWLAAEGLPDDVVKAAAGLAGPYDFYPFDKPNSIEAMGRHPRPLETQPIRFVRRDAPPLWLGHGTADTNVRIRNSRNLAAALSKAGAPVTLREYPGSSHNDPIMAVSRPFRSRLPVLDESSAFLLAHSRRSRAVGRP